MQVRGGELAPAISWCCFDMSIADVDEMYKEVLRVVVVSLWWRREWLGELG